MIIDMYGSHIITYLFLPFFTLGFKGPQTLTFKQMQMKAIKKVKRQHEGPKKPRNPDDSEEKVEALYDADMDDLDSSDLGEEEK